MSDSKHYGLLQIDHREAKVWALGDLNEKLTADKLPYDPKHRSWHLHSKHQHKGGQYAADDHAYFEAVIKE